MGVCKSSVLQCLELGRGKQQEEIKQIIFFFLIKRNPYLKKPFTEDCLHPSHSLSLRAQEEITSLPRHSARRGTWRESIPLPSHRTGIILTKQKRAHPSIWQIKSTVTFFMSNLSPLRILLDFLFSLGTQGECFPRESLCLLFHKAIGK